MSDPNNLEGPPPTPEERAAMARELDRVAPTPGDKFALMFGQQPTPRTDVFRGKCHSYHKNNAGRTLMEEAQLIERELAEAREEVARLNHALEQASLIYDAAQEHRDEWLAAFLKATKRAGDMREQRDRLAEACRWAQRELGKHTRPSPIDKALASLNSHSASTSPVIE